MHLSLGFDLVWCFEPRQSTSIVLPLIYDSDNFLKVSALEIKRLLKNLFPTNKQMVLPRKKEREASILKIIYF